VVVWKYGDFMLKRIVFIVGNSGSIFSVADKLSNEQMFDEDLKLLAAMYD